MSQTDVVIWRNCSIGALDAEADGEFLSSCFVNNGCLELISDTESNASIIVARTGCGKSATLIRLAQVSNDVINISPSDLSFKYVENSTVLKFFKDAGVNLDIFYRMLWRHVLITELLKARYGWDSEQVVATWFESIFQRLKRDPARARALRYLQDWGDKFWEDTEVRVKEVTEKVEADLKASLSASIHLAKVSADSGAKLSEEERREIFTRGSSVVNKIQMKELSKLLTFMAEEVFDDDQRPFYVTIDNLDENWVSNESKFLLIRSLIEEIKAFRKVQNVKIIVVLRQDLLEKVYNETRDGGFQEEKYEDYYAPLRWRDKDLEFVIDARINVAFRKKYTNSRVTLSDVLPKDRGSDRAISYIIDRTFLRPRDIISFVNECLGQAVGKERITWAAIHAAEEKYSQKRLRSVLDEWTQLFPSLKHALDLVRGMPESFNFSELRSDVIDSVIIKSAADANQDDLGKISVDFLNPDSKLQVDTFTSHALCILYHVGVLGVKSSATSPFVWVYREGRQFTPSDISQKCIFRIHKMFWREFGVPNRVPSYGVD